VDRRAALVFMLVSALWGAPYLLIKIAVGGLSPELIVFARTAVGALVLLPLAARTGRLEGLRPRWRWLMLLGAIEMAVPFTLITAGERHIPSSLAGILVASAPLFVALIAVRISPAERPRGAGLLGLAAGFAGVVVLLGLDVRGGGAALVASFAVLLAAVLYAIAAHVLNARFRDVSPIGVMGAVMAFAALILLIPSALSLPSSAPTAGELFAVLGLGIGCTAVAFVGFASLTADVGPARASIVAYVAPAFAVALGVIFRSETVGLSTIAGLALILSGSGVAATHRG
jgi:drug/metabolite transporter (DMT)-like permease